MWLNGAFQDQCRQTEELIFEINLTLKIPTDQTSWLNLQSVSWNHREQIELVFNGHWASSIYSDSLCLLFVK